MINHSNQHNNQHNDNNDTNNGNNGNDNTNSNSDNNRIDCGSAPKVDNAKVDGTTPLSVLLFTLLVVVHCQIHLLLTTTHDRYCLLLLMIMLIMIVITISMTHY